MALRYALLGLLAQSPQTGYDLRKRFEQVLSRYAWHASYSHIYPELRKMTEDGLIEVVGEGLRSSKTYGITRRGREEFRQWMLMPKEAPVRSEYTLRLFLLSALEVEDMRPLLDDAVRRAETGIAELEAAVDQINATATPDGRPPFARFAAEFGLRYQRLQREWALWVIGELDELPKSTED